MCVELIEVVLHHVARSMEGTFSSLCSRHNSLYKAIWQDVHTSV